MAGLAIGALSLGAGTITALSGPVGSSRTEAPHAVRQSGGVSIELIEQDFTLDANLETALDETFSRIAFAAGATVTGHTVDLFVTCRDCA